MDAKFELRRQLRQRRRALSPRQRRQAARALAHHLTRSPLFRRSRRIACYLAVDGEMDLAPLMQRALLQGKQVYLPVLTRHGPSRMRFRRYGGPGTRLQRNRFGIAEPAGGDDLPPQRLDLVLAPLLAFDRHGHRLGMGGGFYDRTFAFLGQRQRWRYPRIVGIGYAFQELIELPAEPWDVSLWAAVTERGLRRFRRAPTSPANC